MNTQQPCLPMGRTSTTFHEQPTLVDLGVCRSPALTARLLALFLSAALISSIPLVFFFFRRSGIFLARIAAGGLRPSYPLQLLPTPERAVTLPKAMGAQLDRFARRSSRARTAALAKHSSAASEAIGRIGSDLEALGQRR